MQPMKLFAWDGTLGQFVRLTVDHATGNLNVTGGGGGGGGASTIADGADVAQGTTTDVSGANTVIGKLKAIAASLAGTLNVSVGNFPGTQPVSGTVAISTSTVTPAWVRLSDGAVAFVGQKAMASSLPVVVASDQSPLPDNLSQVGGVAIASKAGGTFGQTALPVWPNAVQRDTWLIPINQISSGALVAATRKDVLSLEQAAASTKTIRVRRIFLWGAASVAAAAAANFQINIFKGTAASTAGTAITPVAANGASAPLNANFAAKSLPTIVAATGPVPVFGTFLSPAVGGVLVTGNPVYDWQENGETVPLTLRAGVLESIVIGLLAASTPTIVLNGYILVTEE